MKALIRTTEREDIFDDRRFITWHSLHIEKRYFATVELSLNGKLSVEFKTPSLSHIAQVTNVCVYPLSKQIICHRSGLYISFKLFMGLFSVDVKAKLLFQLLTFKGT